MTIRLASPRPDYCSACFGTTAERYVDLDAVIEGPVVLNPETGVADPVPGGQTSACDALYLCEACATAVCEVLALRPQLHARQRAEIRRLELENRHWKSLAKRLGATIDDELSGVRVRSPNRRKAVA